MNTLRRHHLFVAVALFALLIVCALLMLCVPNETAEFIGVGYIAIIVTVSLLYDIIHQIEKK